MIFNITHFKKEIDDEISVLVGRKYNLIERVKLGGIGSEKMKIIDSSPLIEGMLQYDDQPNHCNMELRRRGVITLFKYRLETYAWVIPYAKLSIYKSEDIYRIYGDAEFVKVERMLNSSALKEFVRKMMKLRVEYLESTSGPHFS